MDMTDTLFRLHDRLQFLECCFQHLVVLAQTIPVTPTIQTIEPANDLDRGESGCPACSRKKRTRQFRLR